MPIQYVEIRLMTIATADFGSRKAITGEKRHEKIDHCKRHFETQPVKSVVAVLHPVEKSEHHV